MFADRCFWYVDGVQKFGGDIANVYNFGIPQKRESKVAFSLRWLLSPVLREYSQRMMTAHIGTASAIYHNGSVSYVGNSNNSGKGFYNGYDDGGNETILPTETPDDDLASRMASVQATVILDGSTHNAAVVSTFSRFFITGVTC